MIEAKSVFATLGNERGILCGNQSVVGLSRFDDELVIEEWPVKFTAKLAGDGAFTADAIATQVAKIAAATARENDHKQKSEKPGL